MAVVRYDSGGIYTSPGGQCFNGILGLYYAKRGTPQLTRGVVVSMRTDDTILPSCPIELGSKLHRLFVVRAVGGEPSLLCARHRFDVPIVEPRTNDPPEIVAIRNALRDGLVVEFAVRRYSSHLPLNEWFDPGANIRGPVAALLVMGYSVQQ